jgi:hypothetical protein
MNIETATPDNQLDEWSLRFGIPIEDSLDHFPFIQSKTCLMPYSFVKKWKILPLEETEGKIVVATCNPLDWQGIEEIRQALGKETIEKLGSKKQ